MLLCLLLLRYDDRLGPPDYHPQTTDCREETLTKDYVQSGYKETVEGLEVALAIKTFTFRLSLDKAICV